METDAFIDQKAFGKLLADLQTRTGGQYEKRDLIYRDLSRLALAVIHLTDARELRRVYAALGWSGNPSIRPIKQCALNWLKQNHPEFLELQP